MGRKLGVVPLSGREVGPHLTQCGQGRGLYLHAKVHLDESSRLATIDMGRGLYGRRQSAPVNFKSGGFCALFREGAGSPHNTM